MYLIGTLVLPVLSIGSSSIRFELIFCLWLALVLFSHRAVQASRLRWHSVLSIYGLFSVIVGIATLVVFLTTRNLIMNTWHDQLVSLYGFLRPLIVLVLFMNVPIDQRFVRQALWALVLLNIPLAVLSIGQTLGLAVAKQITVLGFTSPWRTPVARLLDQLHIIIRSTGVFESPVNNAVFSLLVLTVAGYLLIRGRHRPLLQWLLYLSIGMALASGFTTLSSTFLIGLAVCNVLFVLLLWPMYKRRFLRIAAGVICIVTLTGLLLVPRLSQSNIFSGTLRYQVGRILLGTVLQTRYDPRLGLLAVTYKAIGQRLVLGWGLAQIKGVFVGDSLYVSILYTSGIVGLIVFCWMLWNVLAYTWRTRTTDGSPCDSSQIAFLFTLLLLAVGISAVSFFILRIQEWYWALVGMSLNRWLLQSHMNGQSPEDLS